MTAEDALREFWEGDIEREWKDQRNASVYRRVIESALGKRVLAKSPKPTLRAWYAATASTSTSALQQGEATWAVNEVYRAAKQMQELATQGSPSTLWERMQAAILLSGARRAAELARTWGAD